jgi:hypothetical protein
MLPTSMAHQASACTFHFTYHISSTVVARPTSHRMYDFLLREGLRVLDQGRRAIVLDRPEHIWHTYAITVHGESGWYRPLDSANQWLEMMLELPFKIGTLYRKYRFRKVWLRINLELQLFWTGGVPINCSSALLTSSYPLSYNADITEHFSSMLESPNY